MTSDPAINLEVNGEPHEVPEVGQTLLDALRTLGQVDVKDGCSPQGQCGCCTVLVDGQPRVACVTPLRRANGRSITTPAGLENIEEWASAVCATGASQCGFCTPGIIVRLEGLRTKKPDADRAAVQRALAAHLCRCTGWNTLVDSWDVMVNGAADPAERDFEAASQRASIEGRCPQVISPEVAAGAPVFASDTAPPDALVALLRADGEWVVGESLAEARELAGKVQGRRTTLSPHYPVEVPAGEWDVTLQTTWVEPAPLETDASWCAPGGDPASPLANGGAFGAKVDSVAGAVARRLADEHGRSVKVLMSREDSTRLGPKRPPVAGGANADGRLELAVVATPGIREAIHQVDPAAVVHEIELSGPPTSAAIRAAGWAEVVALRSAANGSVGRVQVPNGGWAEVEVAADGTIAVLVNAGMPLDPVILRSYCIGAAHMATSWVWSEAMAVDAAGEIHDLTVRSFGVLRSQDMPAVSVQIVESDEPPVHASDAVFAAVAAAQWLAAPQWLAAAQGTAVPAEGAALPVRWPVGVPTEPVHR